MSHILQKSKVDLSNLAMPEFHDKMKHANKTRNKCGVAALYNFELYNVCTAHKLVFYS